MFMKCCTKLNTTPGLWVEWAKSHTRAQWWAEELLLLVEEMRRVIVFLEWKANWWYAQGQRCTDI